MTNSPPIPWLQVLAAAMASAAVEFDTAGGTDDVYEVLLRWTQRLVPAAGHVTIVELSRGQLRTVAASDEAGALIDRLQIEAKAGPLIDAILEQRTICKPTIVGDIRWAKNGVQSPGDRSVRSALCVLFPSMEDGHSRTALNLYSASPDALDDQAGSSARLLTTLAHLAWTVKTLREANQNLGGALNSNRVIGTAVGILMERRKVNPTQAFALLRSTSQNTHRKLRDVAQDVVVAALSAKRQRE